MPLRFSILSQQRDFSWDELLSLVTRLDRESAFDLVWVVDHLSTSLGAPSLDDGPCLEAWTALSALAQATTRVRLGTLVSANPLRQPAVLAKMATTVDNISKGRLELGMGSGWNELEYKAFGVPCPPVGERLKQLEEALQVIKLLWTDEMPTYEGRYYTLDKPTFYPGNVQRPHPPILVGGEGEKVTLRLVAKYADASNFKFFLRPSEVRRLFDVLEKHCGDVGRDPGEIRRTVEVPLLSPEPNANETERVKYCAQRQGLSVEEARTLALEGSPDAMRSVLSKYADVGVDEIVIISFGHMNADALLRISDDVLGGGSSL